MSVQFEILTSAEADRLNVLEAIVTEGAKAYIEVGNALLAIRDERLYKQTHARFGDYLRERWDMGRSHGYRLIDAARTASTLVDPCPPMGDTVTPANERVARALSDAAVHDDDEQLLERWAGVIERHGNTPTAAEVTATNVSRDGTPPQPALSDDATQFLKVARTALRTGDARAARHALWLWRHGIYEALDTIAKADAA